MSRKKSAIKKNNRNKLPRVITGNKQAMEAATPVSVNRLYQDSFFCSLFKEPKYRKAAYLLMHPEDADVTDSEFENIQLENIFTIDMYNDICFMVRGRLIILMEHQSRLNYNLPFRVFLYAAEEYKKLLSMEKYKGILHGTELIRIPKPEFYMIYTGTGTCPECLRLSDAFWDDRQNCFLDLNVTVFQDGNAQGIIKEFIGLIMLIKTSIRNGMQKEEALKTAIKQYRHGYEISDFFDGREDVFEMIGEALSLEEMLELRDEANARVISERITKQVTKQDIDKAYRMMTTIGVSEQVSLNAISREYNLPIQEIKEIIQNPENVPKY